MSSMEKKVETNNLNQSREDSQNEEEKQFAQQEQAPSQIQFQGPQNSNDSQIEEENQFAQQEQDPIQIQFQGPQNSNDENHIQEVEIVNISNGAYPINSPVIEQYRQHEALPELNPPPSINKQYQIILHDKTYFVRTNHGIVFPQPLGPEYISEIDFLVFVLNIANETLSEIRFFEVSLPEFNPKKIQEDFQIKNDLRVDSQKIKNTNFYAKVNLPERQPAPLPGKLYKQKTLIVDKLVEFVKERTQSQWDSNLIDDKIYEETIALCEDLNKIKI